MKRRPSGNGCYVRKKSLCGTVVHSQVFLSEIEVRRHTEVGYVRNRTLKVNIEETPQSLPRGARMILKNYSDKEAVQFRE